MANKPVITPELCRQLFRYDAETGRLFWQPRDALTCGPTRAWRSWNRRFAGKPALDAIAGRGYRHGTIYGTHFKAHRVIWAIIHGVFPTGVIDHINGDPTDNRIKNLRSVSQQANSRNQRQRSNNTSGVPGVSWSARQGCWVAYINVDGSRKPLGSFKSKRNAIAVRKAAERTHGYHENHGRAVRKEL